jgi:hypothetical protein
MPLHFGKLGGLLGQGKEPGRLHSNTSVDSCLNDPKINKSDLAIQLAAAPINPTEVIVC